LRMDNLIDALIAHHPYEIRNLSNNSTYTVTCELSERQFEVLTAGGLINHIRRTRRPTSHSRENPKMS
jgi:hypothetical protein